MFVLGIPLNLGLVGHAYVESITTYPLRDDPDLSAYLDLIAPSPDIEFLSSSFQNIPYLGETIEWIETDLNNSKLENEYVTGW